MYSHIPIANTLVLIICANAKPNPNPYSNPCFNPNPNPMLNPNKLAWGKRTS